MDNKAQALSRTHTASILTADPDGAGPTAELQMKCSFIYKQLYRYRETARRVLSLVTTKVNFRLTQGRWHSIGHT